MSVALMYHALYRDDDTSAIDAEDLPYAVAEADFVAQLDRIVALGVGHPPTTTIIAATSGGGCPDERAGARPEGHPGEPLPGDTGESLDERLAAPIVITFDDGHASGHDIALPHLLARGLHAWFFITSGFVGQRPHFCGEAEVRALSEAGMSIGAHGASHAFFDDLAREAARRELHESRERLRAIGAGAVTSMSFPGGRWRRETLELAAEAGYEYLFDSRTDTLASPRARGGWPSHGEPLPRVAIRRGTPPDVFERMITGDPAWFRRRRAVQGVKHAARAVLGNRIYHGLYQSLS